MYFFISNPYPYPNYTPIDFLVSNVFFFALLGISFFIFIKLYRYFFPKSYLLDFNDEVDRFFILNFCLEGIEQIEVLENE